MFSQAIRRAAHRARLQVQELDSRRCPSCTIQVADGHILQILGDQTANAVEVTEGNTGISVVCDGQKAQSFTGIEQVVIRTFSGSDSVKYICPYESPNLARVHFELGADEDTFSAIGDGVHVATALNFDGDAGPGADVVTFSGLSAPGGQLQVLLGAGPDRFSLNDTKFTGSVDISIDAAAGSDLVEIRNDDFAGLTNQGLTALSLNVQLGQGEDRFSMHDSRVACPADVGIDADAGNDVVEFTHDEFVGRPGINTALKLDVRLGNGDDRFSLRESPTIGPTDISIDAEAGNDVVDLPYMEFAGLSNPSQFSALKLDVRLGAGDDKFSVTEGNFVGAVEMNIEGGPGKDVVVVTKNDFASVGEVIGAAPAIIRVDYPGTGGVLVVDDNTFAGGLSLSFAGGNGPDAVSFTNDYSAGPTLLALDLGGGDNVATIHMDTFAAETQLNVRGGNGADHVSLSCGAAWGAFAVDTDLGGGANSLIFEENDFGGSLVSSNRGGSSGESFAFQENRVAGTAELNIQMGNGHNNAAISENDFQREAYIILVGAGGDDDVMFDKNTVGGPLKLSSIGGAGGDMFVVDGNAFFGAVAIFADMGDDNDEVMITLIGFADRDQHIVVKGGEGKDDLCVVDTLPQGFRGAIDVRFFGEAGADELVVKAVGDLLGVANAFLLADGGAGFDHCDVSSMVQVVNCES